MTLSTSDDLKESAMPRKGRQNEVVEMLSLDEHSFSTSKVLIIVV